MKEVLKALAERPMTAPVLARTIGVDQEVLGDMVTGLIGQELVEEDGNKLVITDLGRKSLGLADSAHSLPESGSLMELVDADDSEEPVTPEPEALLQFIQTKQSATKIAQASGVNVRTVRQLMEELRKKRLAQKDANGLWKAIPKIEPIINGTPILEIDSEEEVIEVDVPASFELAIEEQVPTDIKAALANLSQVLTPRQIQNLPTKLAVLERLSELLDPTIANVLAEIQNDLKVAA